MVTEKDIEKNLKNVEEGKALTIPLKILDRKFKRAYYRRSDIYRKRIELWRKNNPDKVKEYQERWIAKNKDKLRKYGKEYRQRNRKKLREWARKDYQKNRDKIRKYQSKYYKTRLRRKR